VFRSILAKIDRDRDYPPRQFTIDVNRRVLEGALYEHMAYGFHQEQTGGGEYIPLRERRPSVRYNLCRLVVDDSVSLLFSEGHFPTPHCEDAEISRALAGLIKETGLNAVMLEAAMQGSVGSIAVQMRILEQAGGGHRAFFSVHSTEFLTPSFQPANPDALMTLAERYKVKGAALKAQGYAVADPDLTEDFWFARTWDDQAETWFLPQRVGDDAPPVVDLARTVRHGLGFVPWVWVKNLPGKLRLLEPGPLQFSDIDGACTFSAAIETMIELEYQLSQGGRGLKYSMDPQLVLKEPAAEDGQMIKSPANALVMDAGGEAKLLELGGSAFQVVLEWVRALRELALETAHGNRASAEKLSAAQSGRAMELMNQSLIWLTDRLRVSYGEGALLHLLRMALAAHRTRPLTVMGRPLPELAPEAEIALKWPAWHHPTYADLQLQGQTLTTLAKGGVMSRETAVRALAANYDIEDVGAEVARIEGEVGGAPEAEGARAPEPEPVAAETSD
jgi:hypothetical protein